MCTGVPACVSGSGKSTDSQNILGNRTKRVGGESKRMRNLNLLRLMEYSLLRPRPCPLDHCVLDVEHNMLHHFTWFQHTRM